MYINNKSISDIYISGVYNNELEAKNFTPELKKVQTIKDTNGKDEYLIIYVTNYPDANDCVRCSSGADDAYLVNSTGDILKKFRISVENGKLVEKFIKNYDYDLMFVSGAE